MSTHSNTETKPAAIYSDGEYLRNNKDWHTEDSPYKASFVRAAIKRNSIAFTKCADVGCGAGLVTELLAKTFPEKTFVGYDLSSDAQEFWKQRSKYPNLSYSNANLLEADISYDLIICLDVVEHIEDYFGFLRSLRTKGKTFIFNIPLDMSVLKIITPGIRYAREEFGHLHYFNRYTAIKTLQDCGYTIRDAKLAVPYVSTMPRKIRQWLALPFRVLSLSLGKNFASKVFGGISLVITAAVE